MAYNFLTLDEKQGCCVIKKKEEKNLIFLKKIKLKRSSLAFDC
jgi:hypothetical protein